MLRINDASYITKNSLCKIDNKKRNIDIETNNEKTENQKTLEPDLDEYKEKMKSILDTTSGMTDKCN